MSAINKIGMLILTAIIVAAFFLPWVRVESPAIGKISKFLTGKEQAVISGISGFAVPVLANSKESRFMISVIKIFNPGITNADKKSYLIWVVPGLAVIMLLVKWFLDKNKWINLAFGLIGSLIFLVAVYKINTTDLDKLVLRVGIAPGLWLILFAYLGIGLLCLSNFVCLLKQKSRSNLNKAPA
jgi:hypothetical protein